VAGKPIQIQDVLLDPEYTMIEVQKKAGSEPRSACRYCVEGARLA